MPSNTNRDRAAWPDIDIAQWGPTKRSLHLYTQMLGKIELALNPPQPNWMFTPLHLTARGLTTGTMPFEGTAVDVLLDVFSSEIIVRRSNGAQRQIPLLPPRSVAEVFVALDQALDALGITCVITPVPQEVPDTTPFDTDTRPAAYDSEAVIRWHHAAIATAAVFEEWRSRFFGRSGIQLWWGAFDLALILFNGRKVPPPTDRGYLLKYDLDAELMNCGLYFGDETNAPFFYGYIYPQPPGAPNLPMSPPAVSWSSTLNEWVLPYDVVRAAPSPEALLLAFLDSLYAQCIAAAGWDRDQLSYDAPRTAHRAR